MKRTGMTLGLCLILAWASSAPAADWHVSPDGDDGADGSQATPLASLAEAVQRASAGDRILLERGQIHPCDGVNLGADLSLGAWGAGTAPELTASQEVTLPDRWAALNAVHTGADPQPDRAENAVQLTGHAGHLFKLGAIAKGIELFLKEA